jgi:hypothetical protein
VPCKRRALPTRLPRNPSGSKRKLKELALKAAALLPRGITLLREVLKTGALAREGGTLLRDLPR